MADMNTCDCCGKEEPSIDLFWNMPFEDDTEKQLRVIEKMKINNFEAICFECFYKFAEEELDA